MTKSVRWPAIAEAARLQPRVEILADADAEQLATRFASRFVEDPGATWWWSALRDGTAVETVEYGEQEPWPDLRRLVPAREVYELIVTDDCATPSGVVRGSLDDLIQMILESPFFEYVITDGSATFGVFDTHHNTLVSVRRT